MKEMISEILRYKAARNAVILAHFYQLPEIQDLADFVGDSLELARAARDTDAKVIVFCGVRFMAETAKVLCPDKTVLLPEPGAGCPMADMITADDVLRLRAEHPKAAVMCYVNSDLEVKAASDICCTSSNAVRVARSLREKEIIFVPDRCLGSYVASLVPEKRFILCDGFCPTHAKITAADIDAAREARPGARVLVHPECVREVLLRADYIGSTSQIISEAVGGDGKEYIIGTEEGVLHRLQKLCPDKRFFTAGRGQMCPNMKKTRLESVRSALEKNLHPIEVAPAWADKALLSLRRMLEIPAGHEGAPL